MFAFTVVVAFVVDFVFARAFVLVVVLAFIDFVFLSAVAVAVAFCFYVGFVFF